MQHTAANVTAWMMVLLMAGAGEARPAEVRLYPSALVTQDLIRVGDIADLSGFAAAEESNIKALVVADAPPPGGSRLIPLAAIRETLGEGGVNLAHLRLMGSSECAIRRPAPPADTTPKNAGAAASVERAAGRQPSRPSSGETLTLRQFIEERAGEEMLRFGGRARVAFSDEAETTLAMTSPPLRFELIRRLGPPLGSVTYEVAITQDAQRVQRVSIKAEVSLVRAVLIAARPILKGALVRPDDVRVEQVASVMAAEATVADPSLVVGRQAQRFFAQGESLDPTQFAAVPLVLRGQLVRVLARVGGIRLESVGEALAGGAAGDVVRVKLADRGDEQLSGIISGPAEVTVGAAHAATVPAAAAAEPQVGGAALAGAPIRGRRGSP